MLRADPTHSIVLAAFVLAAPLLAQQQSGAPTSAKDPRRPVPEAEYAKWETLGAGALSPDGKWFAYDFRRVNGTGELRWRAVDSDAEHTVRSGCAPVFTNNNHFLLYTVSGDTGCAAGGRGGRGGRGGGAPPAATGRGATTNRNRVGIVDLRSGATTVLQEVQTFNLSNDGAHVALRRYPAAGRRGADLVVRDLDQGTEITFGNVADYSWSDDGALLGMTIDVDGRTGNGVQVLNAGSGAIRSLDAGDLSYSNIVWRPKSTDLVAFRSRGDSAFADTSYSVLAWKDVASGRPSKSVYDFSADGAFPRGMRVASYRAPVWSEDGATLFFGIAPREPKTTPTRGGIQPARVEVWHWKDLRPYHMQDRQAAQDRQRTHLVAWAVGQNRIARLADDSLESVQLNQNRTVAVASDETPYFKEVISGRQYRDVYRIDIASGKRDKILTKVVFAPDISPNGNYLLYAQNGQWWSYDLRTGTRANLTGQIKSAFVNMEDDHPVHERRPYGVGGWLTGEKSVILYDRFDLWQVNADGTNPVRLTRGKEDSTVYRVVTLEEDQHWIDPSMPMTLSADGEYNKKSGYARLTIGQPARHVIWLDKDVSRLTKAKTADVGFVQMQTYEESPNFFLVSGAAGPDGTTKRLTNTNAFQSDYAWGKQVLMNYTNKRGDKLQMMLTYPADYQPGKKYPMVVYYYEKLSQGFHSYVVPTERATYNTTVFSQNGYFVLRPDILFRAREPGYSGLECVTAAVKATLAAVPDIDPKKVGNMGHSWGGYQSAFYAVHGHGMFAATIAGAPLTNLISMYGYTSFNTGSPETGHFETGQERMQVPLWEDPQAYIRNSTVFSVDSLQTPLLLEEGDADGNVNPWQSMELYNFGRRLGKQVVYLIYNDENHGVARPESQMDYHTRQLQWFAHYLKGEQAADWITKGETYLTRQKLLKDATPPEGGRGGGGRGGNP